MLDAILQAYPWYEHPEGMRFAETARDAYRTVGHWLFVPGSVSVFHRVMSCEEIWAIHVGRLDLHVIDPAGAHQRCRLGLDLASGEHPMATVARGFWQAAELPPEEPLAFGTNVCAPAFQFSELQIGTRAEMLTMFPQHGELIRKLTR